MRNNISTIITLYRTPLNKLENLKFYKKLNLHIFEQENNNKKDLKKILNFKFQYFFSQTNIGLSKSSNILLNEINTTYGLFTQADVSLDKNTINELKKVLKKNKKIIFATPNFKKKKFKKKIVFVKKINAACILFDVKKLKKIGFFDEDFFLYWEDIDLMNKINRSKYKMAIARDANAKHTISQSSEDSRTVVYIRNKNYIYGELTYDYKQKRIRFIKIIRKFNQNFFLFFFNIARFQFNKSIINFAYIIGIAKFLRFYLTRQI